MYCEFFNMLVFSLESGSLMQTYVLVYARFTPI